MADFEKMEQVRHRVDEIVKDPATAEALKPWYRQFCKRPCFHDEYLPTYNRPNVTLVDTQGQGVERITEKGVVANGVEYELDCIVYATGFEVGTEYERRAGYPIYGEGGLSLGEKWQDGITTLFGMHTRGFPNCFIISIAQVGISANIPHILDEQSKHIAYVIKEAEEREVRALDVTPEAESDWVKKVMDASLFNLEFLEACTPGYYNNEGQPNGELARQNGTYAAGIMKFAEQLSEWRQSGELPGLDLTRR
jgi:cyclohexanone monooxygenase